MKALVQYYGVDTLTIGALLLGFILPAGAACNNPNNWLEAPGTDARILIGKQDKQSDLEGETNGESDEAYPIPLPKEMLKMLDAGRLPTNETATVSYYEPNGKGQLRVCRMELWFPPGFGDPENLAMLAPIARRYVSNNPKIAKLTMGSVPAAATLFYYDSKGRIVRVSEGSFDKPDEPVLDKMCRYYDDKDRVILAVNPRTSKVRPKGNPDPRDSWRRYKYGEFKGEKVILLSQGHSGEEDGSWTEDFSPFRFGASPDAPWGNAEADSKNGVTVIIGSSLGKLDDNVANTVVDSFGHWNGSTYTFTKLPVPVSVLENADGLYQYDRRRQTYVDGQLIKLYEFFKANEHLSRHRYYMLDGFLLRHEQLDAKGKVIRVITVGDWRQPRPGPKPDVNDRLLSTHAFALLAHQVYHRVYDINAAGKPVLVALSWNRAIRLNPSSKVPMDYADLVYGTPDGKERWKTKADFEKAFNTSARAAHVFPDEHGPATPIQSKAARE